MITPSRRLCAVLCLALANVFVSRAFGGFTLISRQSSLDYQNTIGGENFSKTSSTDHFGVYTDSLSFSKSDAAGSSGSTAARQSTSAALTNGSVLSGGTLFAQAMAQFDPAASDIINFGTESEHIVEFQVTGQTQPFHLTGNFGTQSTSGANALVKIFTVITHAGQKGIDVEYDNSELAKFNTFGDLPPGAYKLVATVDAGAVNFGPGNGQDTGRATQVQFHFEAGPAASAIPLPPALYAGAPLLALVGLMAGTRRAKARIAR